MSDEREFLLRDVLERLQAWRGSTVAIYVWEPETGLSFLGFRATVDRLDFDADLDASGGRLEVHFAEEGHVLILYADLVDDGNVDDTRIDLQYRGGNIEIVLREA